MLAAVAFSIEGCRAITHQVRDDSEEQPCAEEAVVGNYFSGRPILNPSRLSVDAQQFSRERAGRPPCEGNGPTLVRGDFNDDGRIDFAAIMAEPTGGGEGAELAFFLSDDGGYRVISGLSYNRLLDDIMIFPVDETYLKTVDLDLGEGLSEEVRRGDFPSAAVEIIYFGKGSSILVWNEDMHAFGSIPTGE